MKNLFTKAAGQLPLAVGLAFALTFSSCQKDDTAPEPEPFYLDGLPGAAYLGRGYNAFGEFAAAGALKGRLIGFENYRKEKAGGQEYKVPADVEVLHQNENKFGLLSGPTIEEYQARRAAAIGLSADYPFFSGSVTANFQEIHYRTPDYFFVNVSNEVNLWKVSLPYDPGLLRAKLTEEARADLAGMASQELFGKYGTHLLVSAAIGGRADYFVAVEKNEATNQLDMEVAAKASFKESLGALDPSVESEYAEMIDILRKNSFIGLKIEGGDPAYGSNILSKENYSAWAGSVEDAPALSALSNLSLMPLWELCESEARRTEVEEAFKQYALHFNLPEMAAGAGKSITDILIKAGSHSDPYYYQESGYKVIPENLNAQTGGKYVYLMYREGLDTEASITELATVSGFNPTAPGAWFRIRTNLNEGTGAGDPEVYLCYQRAVTESPIRQVQVVKGESTLPTGFELVKNFYYGNVQDLNQGAGGTPVHIAFSREKSGP